LIKKILGYAFLLLLTFLVLVPEYYLIVTTFKTGSEASAAPMALPKHISFDRYITAFQKMQYPRVFANTLIITVFSVGGIIFCAAMGGYVLNRKSHTAPGKVMFTLILAGLVFPFSMSMLGLYRVVQKLRLMNTLAAVICIHAAGGIPYATFLFKSFMNTVPYELEESARIDGAGVIHTFWRIIFPLLKPIIATVTILDSLVIWNDFMIPLYFIQSRRFNVLLQEVNRNIGAFSTDWTNLFPMLVLAVIPLLVFYLLMQRFIIEGVMSGSLKG
jgi:raffinose/stachyose/melibiose transport system permease protein